MGITSDWQPLWTSALRKKSGNVKKTEKLKFQMEFELEDEVGDTNLGMGDFDTYFERTIQWHRLFGQIPTNIFAVNTYAKTSKITQKLTFR